MLVCGKCNSTVEMGKVFCPVCGAKMDTHGLDRKEVARHARRRYMTAVPWRKLGMALVVWLLVCVLLAIWPRDVELGAQGQKPWANRLPDRLEVVTAIRAGQSLEIEISEREINSYITYVQVPRMSVDSCRVNLEKDHVTMRMIRRLGKVSRFGFQMRFALSWDVQYLAHHDELYVKRASIGHLPLVGPLKRLVGDRVRAAASALPEWSAWTEHVEGVSVSEDALTLKITR